MQIVIDIPEYLYEQVLDLHNESILGLAGDFTKDLIKGVAYGTPLPKGHGRLLDEKEILNTNANDGGWYDLVDMPEYIEGVPAIIEADKE